MKTLGVGVAGLDQNAVEAGNPRPALDGGHDPAPVAHGGCCFDTPVKQTADDALVDEVVARLQLAAGGKLRHARRGAGTAGTPVDRPFTVKDRVAGMGLGLLRRAAPEDMADAANRRVLGMNSGDRLVDRPAEQGRQAQDRLRRQIRQIAIVFLRFDNRVEIAALGDVDPQFPQTGAIHRDALRGKVGGDIGDPHCLDKAVFLAISGGDLAGRGLQP